MATVRVELSDKSYSIEIAGELLSRGEAETLLPVSQQYAIITNQKVADLYLKSITELIPEGSSTTICLIPDTEESKSFDQYTRLLDLLLSEQFNRSSTIIALGGGVVGDLAGFVAATLHRGCNLVQIPTTLLAQVDSSVGGKTAINHATGKNLIGSFYQPEVVIIDPETLRTLDKRQFSAGMAEVIKYAFIQEQNFLPWLEENVQAIVEFDTLVLEEMIGYCCEIKAAVVSADEKEKGQRALLNFGHTFAHAVEYVSGYGTWLHGEAVSVGMLLAAKLSVENGLMEQDLFDRLKTLLEKFDLPVVLSSSFSAKEILNSMYRDKKNLTEKLQLVLPRAAGHCELVAWNEDAALLDLLQSFGTAK